MLVQQRLGKKRGLRKPEPSVKHISSSCTQEGEPGLGTAPTSAILKHSMSLKFGRSEIPIKQPTSTPALGKSCHLSMPQNQNCISPLSPQAMSQSNIQALLQLQFTEITEWCGLGETLNIIYLQHSPPSEPGRSGSIQPGLEHIFESLKVTNRMTPTQGPSWNSARWESKSGSVGEDKGLLMNIYLCGEHRKLLPLWPHFLATWIW